MKIRRVVATTDILTKILVYLKIAKIPVHRTMIKKGIVSNSNTINDGLKWLCAHGLVKREKIQYINGAYNRYTWFYSLRTKRFK